MPSVLLVGLLQKRKMASEASHEFSSSMSLKKFWEEALSSLLRDGKPVLGGAHRPRTYVFPLAVRWNRRATGVAAVPELGVTAHCTDWHSISSPTMIIPVRCFTCGKVIGNKWETYLDLLQAGYSEG